MISLREATSLDGQGREGGLRRADAPHAIPGEGRARDDVDATRPVAGEVEHGVRQELVLGRGGLRAERGYHRGARGAVLDRHPHARALPGLREHLDQS